MYYFTFFLTNFKVQKIFRKIKSSINHEKWGECDRPNLKYNELHPTVHATAIRHKVNLAPDVDYVLVLPSLSILSRLSGMESIRRDFVKYLLDQSDSHISEQVLNKQTKQTYFMVYDLFCDNFSLILSLIFCQFLRFLW